MANNLSDSETLLRKALTDLEAQWQQAGSEWNDKAREDFEKEHLEPLRVAVTAAGHGMRNIDQMLRQVIRECS